MNGVFVDLGGADGLAHMTELTWERGKKAKDIYNVGDIMYAEGKDVRPGKILDLPLSRLNSLRRAVTQPRYAACTPTPSGCQ